MAVGSSHSREADTATAASAWLKATRAPKDPAEPLYHTEHPHHRQKENQSSTKAGSFASTRVWYFAKVASVCMSSLISCSSGANLRGLPST